MKTLAIALLSLLSVPCFASFDGPKRSVSVAITEGGRVVRGDDEIDTDDYTKVAVQYEITVDEDDKNAHIWVRLDAYECNSDKTYGDTHLRLEKKLHLYSAPEGMKIDKIADVPLTGQHSEFLRGERHGPQSFESKKLGGLRNLTFTIDGRGRKDHDRMNLRAEIDFIPKLVN